MKWSEPYAVCSRKKLCELSTQRKMASCFQNLCCQDAILYSCLWGFASIFKNASIFGFDSKNASICVDISVSLFCIKVGRVFSQIRSSGLGCISSTIMRMIWRGVRNWPYTPAVDRASAGKPTADPPLIRSVSRLPWNHSPTERMSRRTHCPAGSDHETALFDSPHSAERIQDGSYMSNKSCPGIWSAGKILVQGFSQGFRFMPGLRTGFKTGFSKPEMNLTKPVEKLK